MSEFLMKSIVHFFPHLEFESLFKKVQFYRNLNKLEEAHLVEPEMKHTECFEGRFEIKN